VFHVYDLLPALRNKLPSTKMEAYKIGIQGNKLVKSEIKKFLVGLLE